MTPLDGIRILDLTHVLAGPYATGQLALMGAEVIRVENPAGSDFIRFMGGTDRMRRLGLAPAFLSQNAGKRSVALDLKSAQGREIFLDLAATADVVTENFRPGVVDRLGVGFDAVLGRRPDVIYASLTGFGPDGPLAGRPAYDHIIQGVSGLMAMTGTPESGPLRSGLAIVDYVAGQALVAAILAALLQRAKAPDRPQRLHVSMLDAITNFMGAPAVGHQATGRLRGLEGNRAASDSPWSGRFATSDGHIVVTANTAGQAERLCAALGLPDLVDEPDPARKQAALIEAFARETAATWEARLEEAHVPCGRVLTLDEVLDHPQMAASPSWRELDVPELGQGFRVPGLAFRAPWQPDRLEPAPVLGRDTRAVLEALGYTGAEIDGLHAAGVLACPLPPVDEQGEGSDA